MRRNFFRVLDGFDLEGTKEGNPCKPEVGAYRKNKLEMYPTDRADKRL